LHQIFGSIRFLSFIVLTQKYLVLSTDGHAFLCALFYTERWVKYIGQLRSIRFKTIRNKLYVFNPVFGYLLIQTAKESHMLWFYVVPYSN
jgi:hypothetical protein